MSSVSSVGSEEEVMERLHAFFVALEHLNHCELSLKDGPMIYMKMLLRFCKETPGLQCLILADKLIRKEVACITSDERDLYHNFSEGLMHVLSNCKYLWDKARTEAHIQKLDQSKFGSPEARKRPALSDEHEQDKELDKKRPVTKSKLKREKAKARLAKAVAGSAPDRGSGGGGSAKPGKGGRGKGGSSKSSSKGSPQKVPAREWSALLAFKPAGKKRCPFWNSSLGCRFGDDCGSLHICMECGGNHTWCSTHM